MLKRIEMLTAVVRANKKLQFTNYAKNKVFKISGSKYVTISLVIPLGFGIYQKLMDRQATLETSEGIDFCDNLISGIKKRLLHYENRSITRIATILDPRFKKEAFQFNSNMEAATKLVEDEVQRNCIRNNATAEDSGEKPSTSGGESSCFFDFLDARLEERQKSSKIDAIISMRQYFEANNAARDDDPLMYWKVIPTNQKCNTITNFFLLTPENLNPLKESVQKYFCIPATSVES